MAASKSFNQCDICLHVEGGDSQIVIGYCENCDEHLCEDCFNCHKNPKPCRDHIVIRIQEIGRQIRRREYDITSEKCKVHSNYFVEFYCEDHNQVGCANCHLKYHKQCENITDLREINRDVLCSSQVNDCRTALRELDQDAEAIESEVRQNEEKIQVTSTECLEKMEQFRHEINENVDKLQTQLADEAKKVNVQNSQILNATSGSCEVVRDKIKERISEIERYEENGHACRMYVALKGLNEDIVSIRNDLRKTRATNHVKLYTFNPDRQLKSSIFEDVERFGNMEEVVDGSEEVCGTETKDIKILTKKEMIDDLQQQVKEKTTLSDKYEQQVNDVTMHLEKRIKDKERMIDDFRQELQEKSTHLEKREQELQEQMRKVQELKEEQEFEREMQGVDYEDLDSNGTTNTTSLAVHTIKEAFELLDLPDINMIGDLQQQVKKKTTLADKYEQQVNDVTMHLEKRIKDKERMVDDLGQQLQEKTKQLEKREREQQDEQWLQEQMRRVQELKEQEQERIYESSSSEGEIDCDLDSNGTTNTTSLAVHTIKEAIMTIVTGLTSTTGMKQRRRTAPRPLADSDDSDD